MGECGIVGQCAGRPGHSGDSREQAAGITTAAVFTHRPHPPTPSVKLRVHST